MIAKDIVIEALLTSKNHILSLPEIMDYAEKKYGYTTKNEKARINAALGNNSSDGKTKFSKNIFYSVKGIGEGVWGLRDEYFLIQNIDDEEEKEYWEGKEKYRSHLVKERNQNLVKKAKEQFKQKHNGKLFCEVCGIDMAEKYGKAGEGYIEAHHLKPVSDMKPGEKAKIDDLIMLCPNCHRMVHRHKEKLTRENIKSILKE